jgi:hypothetical protein
MKDNSTAFATVARQQRYRNQATGVSPCLTTSEAQGAERSRRVIDAAPVSQLRVKDTSYPAPGPVCDPLTGVMVDKVTGKRWKPVVNGPSVWTR